MLAGAGRPQPGDVLAQQVEQRFGQGKGFGSPADHDRQGRIAGANVATRHRCIQNGNAARCTLFRQLHGQIGTAGRHVYRQAATGPGKETGIRIQPYLLDILGITHHRENGFGLRPHLGRGLAPGRAMLQQRRRLLARPVVDEQRMPGRLQMPSHGNPHDTGANPANLHDKTPSELIRINHMDRPFDTPTRHLVAKSPQFTSPTHKCQRSRNPKAIVAIQVV